MEKVDISNLVIEQLPDFIQADYDTFSEFIKAYYKFVDTNYKNDLLSNIDIDKTVDELVARLKNQYHISDTHENVDDKKLIRHLKELYTLKGTEEAFRFFFKILFDKDVLLEYPSKDLLVPSQSTYYKKTTIVCQIIQGDYTDLIGERVTINSDGKFIELEIVGAVQLAANIVEFEINPNYFGEIAINDIFYNASETIFAKIIPTISEMSILQNGDSFKVGQLVDITDPYGSGATSKIRILETEKEEIKVPLRIGSRYFEGNFLPAAEFFSSESDNTLYFVDGKQHNLIDDDVITFSEHAPGGAQVNTKYYVKVVSPYKFQLLNFTTRQVIDITTNVSCKALVTEKYGFFYCSTHAVEENDIISFFDPLNVPHYKADPITGYTDYANRNSFGIRVHMLYTAVNVTKNGFCISYKGKIHSSKNSGFSYGMSFSSILNTTWPSSEAKASTIKIPNHGFIDGQRVRWNREDDKNLTPIENILYTGNDTTYPTTIIKTSAGQFNLNSKGYIAGTFYKRDHNLTVGARVRYKVEDYLSEADVVFVTKDWFILNDFYNYSDFTYNDPFYEPLVYPWTEQLYTGEIRGYRQIPISTPNTTVYVDNRPWFYTPRSSTYAPLDNGQYFYVLYIDKDTIQLCHSLQDWKAKSPIQFENLGHYSSKVNLVIEKEKVKSVEFLQHSYGYTKDFTVYVKPSTIENVEDPDGICNVTSTGINIEESNLGFKEFVSFSVYNFAFSNPTSGTTWSTAYAYDYVVKRDSHQINFGYTGAGEYTDTTPQIIDNMILRFKVGPVTSYSSVFRDNSSFLNDKIYIHDNDYYQYYSYVVKTDMKLEEYANLLKKYLHTSGFKVFGKEEINNNIQLDSLVSSLTMETATYYGSSYITQEEYQILE